MYVAGTHRRPFENMGFGQSKVVRKLQMSIRKEKTLQTPMQNIMSVIYSTQKNNPLITSEPLHLYT